MEEVTYEEFINNILETRGRFACGDEYHERHHIVPKCMGGTNDKDNLIDLFAREHFEVHRLLALENPDDDKLVYAWWCMSVITNEHTKERYKLTAEEYEEARIEFSKIHSERMSGKNHPLYGKPRVEFAGENNPNYGKPTSEEQRKCLSEKMKGRYCGSNNPMYGVHRYGEDAPMFGKRHTTEARQKMSDNHANFFGENNPNYGKCHSEEARQKMSTNHANVCGKNNPNAHKVIRLFDLKIYDYLNEAAKENHMHRKTIREHCKQHLGFMYYDEWLKQQNDCGGDKIDKEVNSQK